MTFIPTHKCTPYCKVEEGIHCLPNLADEGMSVLDAQNSLPIIKVLDVKEEDDVTMDLIERSIVLSPSYEKNPDAITKQGYLIWVRDWTKEERTIKWQT